VSPQTSAQLADWNNVRQSLAQICANYDEFDSFFSGAFDRLEELALELVRRQRGWASDRDHSRSELDRRKADLDGAWQQVEQEREQSQAELARQKAEVEEERQRMELRREETKTDQPAANEEREAQIRRLEKERDELVQQQRLLAAELDTVRSRAAEMAERLAHEESRMAAERARWGDELKRMRQVIESLARQQAEQPLSATRPAAAAETTPAGRPPQADPVLGSVMAQFEMLQRDVAERRKKTAGAAN
jgi:chromosome segregation ATPase